MTATPKRSRCDQSPGPADASDLVSPAPETLALCDEFLRRDRAWRDMGRPTDRMTTADRLAAYRRMADAWHFGGEALVAVQNAVRPLVRLCHEVPTDPGSPIVVRIHWEHGGYLWRYNFDGHRLTLRKA